MYSSFLRVFLQPFYVVLLLFLLFCLFLFEGYDAPAVKSQCILQEPKPGISPHNLSNLQAVHCAYTYKDMYNTPRAKDGDLVQSTC